ncbi:MAG: mechanosensitive ion channel domain-containing protein [Aequorivita sp.]
MIALKEFYPELIESAILLLVLFLLRAILKKTVRDFTKKIERLEHRTGLIIKHINFAIFFLIIIGLIVIWGLDFKHLGLFMSSIFAVIGIAFFAQWSILSNITSGVIMFFTFPYKIGDYIKIHDKEAPLEGLIEDIKTFHIILHTSNNEIITYPNSMMLQKGVSILKPEEHHQHAPEEDKNKEQLPHD